MMPAAVPGIVMPMDSALSAAHQSARSHPCRGSLMV